MIHFKCPYCDKAIKVREVAAGRDGNCLGCGQTIRVPQSDVLDEGAASDETSTGGLIAYFGLEDWWLTSFTPDEQDYIQRTFAPLGKGASNNLVTGQIMFSTQTAVVFLRSLSSWFNNKKDRHLAERILAKALHTGGEFWFHKVGRLKSEGRSEDLVGECAANIPFPAAFREIARAIRKDVRDRRKKKADTRDLLALIYRWAVIENFFSGCRKGSLTESSAGQTRIEWNRVNDEELIHSTAKLCIKGIETPYETIGYANLALLNKTDVKWLVEALGEPKSHSSAKEANLGLWHRAVKNFRVAAQEDERRF